jgi:hypothetical protein
MSDWRTAEERRCVRCDEVIPLNIGFVLIPGRTKPEVPCCVRCYNQNVDRVNRARERTIADALAGERG